MTSTEQLGFRALADPTRRSILQLLAKEDMTIAEVTENFQMTRATMTRAKIVSFRFFMTASFWAQPPRSESLSYDSA